MPTACVSDKLWGPQRHISAHPLTLDPGPWSLDSYFYATFYTPVFRDLNMKLRAYEHIRTDTHTHSHTESHKAVGTW